MSTATVHPMRLRIHDSGLACDVRKVIGYRATCACGWEGPYRVHFGLARADMQAHNREKRGT